MLGGPPPVGIGKESAAVVAPPVAQPQQVAIVILTAAAIAVVGAVRAALRQLGSAGRGEASRLASELQISSSLQMKIPRCLRRGASIPSKPVSAGAG